MHLQQHKQSHPDTPLVLGMSAPQGSGKTTICEELQHLLSYEGYQAVFASLDDFYLTFDAQQALAKVTACSAAAYVTTVTYALHSTLTRLDNTPGMLLLAPCVYMLK